MSRLLRFFNLFRRLQWKLTLSYTLTTVVVLFFVEILLILLIYTIMFFNVTEFFSGLVQATATEAAPRSDGTSIVSQERSDEQMFISPIVDANNRVRGVMVVQTRKLMLYPYSAFPALLGSLGISALFLTLFAGLIGMVFGFFTARSYTCRFKRLVSVVEKWSKGDFSVFARDASQDEIGQLARRLNLMAEQLQNQLHTRQELAALEERNRLARDLHDSVKQQVFAVSMQISAAKVLLQRDLNAAQKHLAEAETLVRQTKQELTTLIRELRPVALEGKGLVQALQEYLNRWQKQTAITASLSVGHFQPALGRLSIVSRRRLWPMPRAIVRPAA